MKIDMSPFYYLVERGIDPVAAYQRSYKRIMKETEFRTWYRGQPLGDAGARCLLLCLVVVWCACVLVACSFKTWYRGQPLGDAGGHCCSMDVRLCSGGACSEQQ
jgi:hypothetical protein